MASLTEPHLLADRSSGQEFFIVVVIPVVFGAITGAMLGINEIAYLVLSLLGILGGYGAGLEHESGNEGLYRGIIGGLLFGTSILLTHGLLDREAEVELPDPETILIAITTILGGLLGFLGGRARAKKARGTRTVAR